MVFNDVKMASTSSTDEIEVIPGRLCFATLDEAPVQDVLTHYFSVDDELEYESFYVDFGPLNLAMLYRYCTKVARKLKSFCFSKKKIVHYTMTSNPQKRTNAVYLIGAYAIIYLNKSAEEVWRMIEGAQPPKYLPFRDAALGPSSYDLHVKDVFSGVEKAVRLKWLDFDTFNVEEYEFYEKVENGDFNWIIPNKILAFCGPHNKAGTENGYPHHSPETYFDYFREHNVSTIVRLNKKLYDAKKFTTAGFEHADLFFVDGSTPSDAIAQRFIDVCERARGAIAVHCKAGLGRTGTLIGLYMMKHFHLTAAETMAWIRICRPGSIIGPQQKYLLDKQAWCWAQKKDVSTPPAAALPALTERPASTANNGGLSHIVSKVDTISISPARAVSTTVDMNENETKEDYTQGDQLMQIKASRRFRASTTQRGGADCGSTPSVKAKHGGKSPMSARILRPRLSAGRSPPVDGRLLVEQPSGSRARNGRVIGAYLDSPPLRKVPRQSTVAKANEHTPNRRRVGDAPGVLPTMPKAQSLNSSMSSKQAPITNSVHRSTSEKRISRALLFRTVGGGASRGRVVNAATAPAVAPGEQRFLRGGVAEQRLASLRPRGSHRKAPVSDGSMSTVAGVPEQNAATATLPSSELE